MYSVLVLTSNFTSQLKYKWTFDSYRFQPSVSGFDCEHCKEGAFTCFATLSPLFPLKDDGGPKLLQQRGFCVCRAVVCR